MNQQFIAMVAHEVNRAYCLSIGDTSQPVWADAPEWQKDSAAQGVQHLIANADLTPEQLHESWMAAKLAAGWKFGPLKDADKKEHPCMVPYSDLPAPQRTKDHLFKAVVNALQGLPDNQQPGAQKIPDLPLIQVDGFTPVKYIGRREIYRDGIYTKLEFAQGQTRMVPTDKAKLMFRHADQYVQGVAAESAPLAAGDVKAKPNANNETEEEAQVLEDAHRALSTMNRQHMASFIKQHFNQDVPADMPVADMRAKAKNLLDQFGLAQ